MSPIAPRGVLKWKTFRNSPLKLPKLLAKIREKLAMFLRQENFTSILNAFFFRYFWESYLRDMWKKKPFESRCALKIFGKSVCCPRFHHLIVFAKFEHSKGGGGATFIFHFILPHKTFFTFFTFVTSKSLEKETISLIQCCTHSSSTKYSCHP